VRGSARHDLILSRVVTAVADGKSPPVPALALGVSYPNPVNGDVLIPFSLPDARVVDLSIYNVLGQRVKQLTRESREPGQHVIQWDGRDAAGRAVASGVYFTVLEANDRILTRRLLVLR
jgi:hypothetical protein